jgi:hypothetical protein
MVKKTGTIILVLIVLVTGFISFRKLNYWDRSIMIFKYDSSVQSFRGRGGRAFGEPGGREGFARRPEFREGMQRPGRPNLPDSLRRTMDGRGQRNFSRIRPGADSIGVIPGSGRDNSSFGRGEVPGGFRGRGGNEGRNFGRGKVINLNMVIYYLAVLSLFTLIMIYLEKCYCIIFKQKKLTQENSDLII